MCVDTLLQFDLSAGRSRGHVFLKDRPSDSETRYIALALRAALHCILVGPPVGAGIGCAAENAREPKPRAAFGRGAARGVPPHTMYTHARTTN